MGANFVNHATYRGAYDPVTSSIVAFPHRFRGDARIGALDMMRGDACDEWNAALMKNESNKDS
jgi:hypothetical protein